MTTAENRRQQLIQDGILPNDRFGHLSPQSAMRIAQLVNQLHVIFGGGIHGKLSQGGIVRVSSIEAGCKRLATACERSAWAKRSAVASRLTSTDKKTTRRRQGMPGGSQRVGRCGRPT